MKNFIRKLYTRNWRREQIAWQLVALKSSPLDTPHTHSVHVSNIKIIVCSLPSKKWMRLETRQQSKRWTMRTHSASRLGTHAFGYSYKRIHIHTSVYGHTDSSNPRAIDDQCPLPLHFPLTFASLPIFKLEVISNALYHHRWSDHRNVGTFY